MKKTIMNKVITAGIVTAALASSSTVYAEKETYTIGIEQLWNIKMQPQIWEQRDRFPTALFPLM